MWKQFIVLRIGFPPLISYYFFNYNIAFKLTFFTVIWLLYTGDLTVTATATIDGKKKA